MRIANAGPCRFAPAALNTPHMHRRLVIFILEAKVVGQTFGLRRLLGPFSGAKSRVFNELDWSDPSDLQISLKVCTGGALRCRDHTRSVIRATIVAAACVRRSPCAALQDSVRLDARTEPASAPSGCVFGVFGEPVKLSRSTLSTVRFRHVHAPSF